MKTLFRITYRCEIAHFYHPVFIYAENANEAIALAIESGIDTHPLCSEFLNKLCRYHVVKV